MAQAFPILTLGGASLAPQFGYLFGVREVAPVESVLSLLWRFARLNGLAGHAVVSALAPYTDPYEGVAPRIGALDVAALCVALGLRPKHLRLAFLDEDTAPRSVPVLRACPRCLRRGYHSTLFQIPTVRRCPLHRQALETRCGHCRREQPYWLSARSLDLAYRCVHCERPPWAEWSPSILARRPFSALARVAFSRRAYEQWAWFPRRMPRAKRRPQGPGAGRCAPSAPGSASSASMSFPEQYRI